MPTSLAEPMAIPAEPHARTGTRLAWVLWLITIGLSAAGLALLAVAHFQPIPDSWGFPGFTALFALSFGSVGAIVVARRPGNRVGQVLLAVGLVSSFQTFYLEYAKVGLITAPGSLPFAILGAWLVAWAWIPFVILAGPVLLSIFPDGRLVSPRWRLPVQFSAVIAILMMVGLAFRQGPLENFRMVDNPVGIIPGDLAAALIGPVALVLSLSMLLPAASLVVRFRRADQDRRQQIKWFAVAGVVFALAAPLGFVAGRPGEIGPVVFILTFCTLPIAAGVAVLRYGLYEIDTIINRALVYGLLTAVLAGIYTASIGVMQRLLKATGADSDAAIILTTLLVVTAFTPIKGRLQALVDRRFKENRDPAARLDAFVKEVQASLSALDSPRTLRRLLGVVVAACDLRGGRVELELPKTDPWSATEGELSTADPAVNASVPLGDGTVRLVLAPSRRTGSISPRDRKAIDRTLAAVVAELA